ncbi:glutathione synthase [Candidatus Kinetoplastibacterium desouzaii TCC079E]|uniref:Glutathione synthetase n=1 Tax=Candidatus Kinetoplastidibacterium desouzai TCC079E TaxID=1208919 RepID=M1LM36_9PROT|nr:glutathione synthase [Candidatus Kinetoplastibacterium desouzaii]AGF46782.1 glutathione synthase [Candidatus Kinetoplastibacterium desouzaii TCC079E]
MHVLFIIDPIETLFAYKDTSVDIMITLIERNNVISIANQKDLFIEDGKVKVKSQRIYLQTNINLHKNEWFYTNSSSNIEEISLFDVVLVRKDPPFDMEYLYMTHILEYAKKSGVNIINNPASIRNYPEKLSILNFPELIAPTIVSSSIFELQKFCCKHQDVIVKPLDGMGGTGIFRLKNNDYNLNVILETVTNNNSSTVMVQKYIPEILNGDKRVILINNKIVPFCLARIPKEGETRGNLAVGGRGVAQTLSKNDIRIAEIVSDFFIDKGLAIIGLDIIGDYLTEINITSPTCFVEIKKQTQFNVSGMFVDYLETLLLNKT